MKVIGMRTEKGEGDAAHLLAAIISEAKYLIFFV